MQIYFLTYKKGAHIMCRPLCRVVEAIIVLPLERTIKAKAG